MSNIDINKKQILVLTPRFPFPVIGGDRLRIYKICKELSKHYDLTLLSLCDKREELNYEYDREVFSSVHRVYLSKKKSILNVIFSLFSNTPLQIGYYKSKEFEDKLKQLLPEHSATLSHLIRVGDYVKENKDINFLEMTDAISLNYKRVKEKASLLSLKTFVYSFEQKRLERYERTINNKFSLTTLVSQVDSDYLYPDRPNNVLVCGNGVDAVSLPFSERKIAKDKKITLVFIGNLYSLQNMDGVRWFTKEVLPFLNKPNRVQNFATSKSKSIIASAQENPQEFIERIGFVDLHVQSVDTIDGLRLTLSDGSIIHLRPSGNAPELRCYAEADNIIKAEKLVLEVLHKVTLL
ncbi:TPA: hypothetical protein ACNP36_001668 [Escherichia coli]